MFPRRASSTIAPGNQPTGIRPSNLDAPGLNWKTATAFCVPLQTNSVLPDLSNASASGCAPNGSPGFCRAQIVSTILSERVSITLTVSLPALATTRYFPFGESASAQACKPVTISGGARLRRAPILSFSPEDSDSTESRPTKSFWRSITDTEPSLAMQRSSARTPCRVPPGR